jgi:putative FmdB family regulatory protein
MNMPIYEYKCSCGEEFEKLVMNSSASIECPKCKSTDVTKKFSAFGMSGVDKPFAGSSGCNKSSCSKGSCSSCS